MRWQAKRPDTPPGHWVRGVMYDDTKFEDERPLDRKDIDDAVSDHPVYVGHRGGHTGVVNSMAYEMAGVTNDTPDPEGGRFFREDGELTGKVAEHARQVFFDVGTWPVMGSCGAGTICNNFFEKHDRVRFDIDDGCLR